MTGRVSAHGQDGYTIVELVVTVFLSGLVLALLASIVSSTQDNLGREISRNESNDQIRLAAQTLDRQIRSGNVVYDPNVESFASGDVAPGMSVRIFTQANAPSAGERCVQWRITSDRRLQQRSWTVNWFSDPAQLVTPWRTVATGIQNRVDGVAAFTRTSASILDVYLRVNADPTSKKGRTVEVRQSVSGRNTVFTSVSQPCGPPVPDPSQTGAGGSKVPSY